MPGRRPTPPGGHASPPAGYRGPCPRTEARTGCRARTGPDDAEQTGQAGPPHRPRTAATFYTWQHPAGVHLEARRRRFPDGRQRWELHHLEGSTIPAAAEHADPVGDNWMRLGDLRADLDHLAHALNAM